MRAAKPREIPLARELGYYGFRAGGISESPSPILLAAWSLACRLRRQNFISRALTIPLAMQASSKRQG